MVKQDIEVSKRGNPKIRQGQVVSNKMDKTAVVAITNLVKHPAYGKYIKKTTRYFAHDKENQCQEGDIVKIIETRPLSKKKRWRIQEVITKVV